MSIVTHPFGGVARHLVTIVDCLVFDGYCFDRVSCDLVCLLDRLGRDRRVGLGGSF